MLYGYVEGWNKPLEVIISLPWTAPAPYPAAHKGGVPEMHIRYTWQHVNGYTCCTVPVWDHAELLCIRAVPPCWTSLYGYKMCSTSTTPYSIPHEIHRNSALQCLCSGACFHPGEHDAPFTECFTRDRLIDRLSQRDRSITVPAVVSAFLVGTET